MILHLALFVAIFFSMAMTTEKYGVSVNAVSAKMSVIIPVLFAFFINVLTFQSLKMLFGKSKFLGV